MLCAALDYREGGGERVSERGADVAARFCINYTLRSQQVCAELKELLINLIEL